MHWANKQPNRNAQLEPKDIIFTEVDTKWVHHHHVDAFVITVRMADRNIHRILVDNGSAVDILY